MGAPPARASAVRITHRTTSAVGSRASSRSSDSVRPPTTGGTTSTCSASAAALDAVMRRLEALAERRFAGLILFALALAVYAVRAVGWPLMGGRDLDEYLYDYVQFLDWHPL